MNRCEEQTKLGDGHQSGVDRARVPRQPGLTSRGGGPWSALPRLLDACEALTSDEVGEASIRSIAARALQAYDELDDSGKLDFFTHLIDSYDVDPGVVRAAFARWEAARDAGSQGAVELIGLFDAVEPARQQLMRRINHAPDAILGLIAMRADVRRLLGTHHELAPLDHDLHHLLSSWFNRGFLRLAEVTWDSSQELHSHLVRYEKVHPIADTVDLRRRLEPDDRRVYAFFHPATGDVPLIFVEVALVQGIPHTIGELLEPAPALDPAFADTAVLYSINNALDGLAGVSFGSQLIKQVIDHVRAHLPQLTQFATLSPIPGFRRWLETRAESDDELRSLARELEAVHTPDGRSPREIERIRPPLWSALLRYITVERRTDGRPIDPVARFHLGNGATAWQLNWPANTSTRAWQQSYGAMINYRYEPENLERRHEEFVRSGTVSVGGPMSAIVSASAPVCRRDSLPQHEKGLPRVTPFTTIYRSFAEQAQRSPDKALFELPDGRTLTYRDTADTTRRIAARLIVDGVVPGDRITAQVDKSPEAIALYLATLQVGAIFVPLNTAYTGTEIDYFISDARPRVFVCSPERRSDHLHRRQDGVLVETLGVDREGTLLRDENYHDDVHASTADDPAAILYTSGTTGRAKGAVLTHGNLASNCHTLLEAWRYTAEDRLIHALPIFHIHGLFVAANMTMTAGASMYFLPKFDADTIIDLLPRASVLMGVPTFYTRLLDNPRLTAEACATMRLFISGSAPLSANDHKNFHTRTGHAILERYGMTETGMNTTNPYEGAPRKPGTVGRPLPGIDIRVVDREGGHTLPDGAVGIIEVRGPNVFAGYWQMPEKTATEFRDDGFFITGDLGRIDDGYLSIVGRNKDLVISGGYNIYPKEIEERLDAHPDVLESAVIGVAHPDFGETVVAVVVAEPGHDPRPEELLAFVATDLARFKHPRAVRVVEALPRNAMGKVQKAQLRKQYEHLFATAAH